MGAALDWRAARSLFNGRLEQIVDPLEKGRRLLEQAVAPGAAPQAEPFGREGGGLHAVLDRQELEGQLDAARLVDES